VRLVIWNCQGGLHRKIAAIMALHPDLAIIQECECPDRLQSRSAAWRTRPSVWCGDSPTKGLAVISFSDAQLAIDATHDPALKHLLPVVVAGSPSFRLLAVWTKEDAERRAMYIGQAVLGVKQYAPFIAGNATVVAGDFNSNQSWDRPNRPYRHAEMVHRLEGQGLVSAYHHYYGEAQGAETRNTFYMYRQQDRGFHIDHCFVPRAWTPHLRSVQIGAYADWRYLSDHCPMVVEFDFERSRDPLHWLQRVWNRTRYPTYPRSLGPCARPWRRYAHQDAHKGLCYACRVMRRAKMIRNLQSGATHAFT
jgi:endonuclease/exonuclease/phosphatase family metal-dependent hydrolase